MKNLNEFTEITKKEFYDYVNPRDIVVTSRGYDYSRFETRQREEIGRSYWPEEGEKKYFLKSNLITKDKGKL